MYCERVRHKAFLRRFCKCSVLNARKTWHAKKVVFNLFPQAAPTIFFHISHWYLSWNNWQIQFIRVSWVGQSTILGPNDRKICSEAIKGSRKKNRIFYGQADRNGLTVSFLWICFCVFSSLQCDWYVFWNRFYTRKKSLSSNHLNPQFFLTFFCHKMVE